MKLTLSPKAYHKIMWLNEKNQNETGMFGKSSRKTPLYVEDIILPKQITSLSHVEFDDDGMADLATDLISKGMEPCEFMRIWIHTHPAGIASPSGTDEETFKRVFGEADWSVMLIMPKKGEFYCRLRCKTEGLGETMEIKLPVEIDWAQAGEHSWEQELKAALLPKPTPPAADLSKTEWIGQPPTWWEKYTRPETSGNEYLDAMLRDGWLDYQEYHDLRDDMLDGKPMSDKVNEIISWYQAEEYVTYE